MLNKVNYSSLFSHFLIERVLLLFEESNIANEFSLNMLVEQELRENEELLLQILIGKVNCGVHDTNTMGSNRVGDVSNVDCIERLVCALFLDEDLIVQVV